jgi:hypothetical protein
MLILRAGLVLVFLVAGYVVGTELGIPLASVLPRGC